MKTISALLMSSAILAGCTTYLPVYDGSLAEPDKCTSGFSPIRFKDDTNQLLGGLGISLSNVAWTIQNCNVSKFEIIGLTEPKDDSLESKRAEALRDFFSLFGIDNITFDNKLAEEDDMVFVQWHSTEH